MTELQTVDCFFEHQLIGPPRSNVYFSFITLPLALVLVSGFVSALALALTLALAGVLPVALALTLALYILVTIVTSFTGQL